MPKVFTTTLSHLKILKFYTETPNLWKPKLQHDSQVTNIQKVTLVFGLLQKTLLADVFQGDTVTLAIRGKGIVFL